MDQTSAFHSSYWWSSSLSRKADSHRLQPLNTVHREGETRWVAAACTKMCRRSNKTPEPGVFLMAEPRFMYGPGGIAAATRAPHACMHALPRGERAINYLLISGRSRSSSRSLRRISSCCRGWAAPRRLTRHVTLRCYDSSWWRIFRKS